MFEIFAVATALNLVWELAHFRLYVCPQRGWDRLRRAFLASLGDGALVVLIVAAGTLLLGPRWWEEPSGAGYSYSAVSGLVTAIVVELVCAGLLKRWSYDGRMPLVPRSQLGLSPILQLTLLSPLTVAAARLL